MRLYADEPFDPGRTRRAKEHLVDGGLLATPAARSGVRDVIERSWRRCVSESVPIAPAAVDYRDPSGPRSALCEAAAPVLARLGEHLTDARVAMFVSDPAGTIVMREVNEPRQRDALDNAFAAEGFDFSETSIGTNGLGTVIEERKPVLVRGSEHYSTALEALTCAGTPIFEPFSRRIAGTFAFACAVTDANALMCGMATDVGRQIEANLAASYGARERRLIRSYLVAERHGRDPVIVINERTAFANTAGLPYLSSQSHALLWSHLRDSGRPGGTPTEVPLESGWHRAYVERVDDAAGAAFCVRLLGGRTAGGRPDAAPAHDGPRRGTRARPRASAHPLPDVDRLLTTTVRHTRCVAIDGGPGTGKLRAASALLAARHATGGVPYVVDVATHRPIDAPDRFGAARAALSAGRSVVLRHAQDLRPADVNRIKGLATLDDAAADDHASLLLTVDLDAAPEHVRALIGQIAAVVRLPALRTMHQRIPGLVADILASRPEAERGTRFSSDAMQALMSWTWPGNTAELRTTVEQLARTRPGAVIGPHDLPDRMRPTGNRRPMTLLETAERDAIVTALRRTNGNRSRAADALGIGRTTLYRKLRHYRIDG